MGAVALVFYSLVLLVVCGAGALAEWHCNNRDRRAARAWRRRMM
jgi:hypothetical protein